MLTPPELPREMLLRYTGVAEGRIRTRVLGQPREDVPPVVVVQGMTVSDYLLPARPRCCPDATRPWLPMAVDEALAGLAGAPGVTVQQ